MTTSKSTKSKKKEAELKKLLENMGVKFKEARLLELALTHRSFVHEHKMPMEESNERLEFLGDAVLGVCIAEMLIKQFPEEPEGVLSKRRAALVNQKTLARLAESMEVGPVLRLGKGEEKTGGRTKRSLLCDAFEALIGALYLDQGLEPTHDYISKMFVDLIPDSRKVESSQDYKTRLQEYFQSEFRRSPRYSLVREYGPDHSKTFEVRVEANDQILGTGSGSSKREAEQDAAKNAFEFLKLDDLNSVKKKKKRKKKKKKATKAKKKKEKSHGEPLKNEPAKAAK